LSIGTVLAPALLCSLYCRHGCVVDKKMDGFVFLSALAGLAQEEMRDVTGLYCGNDTRKGIPP
jgi:hypothetical protein